MRVTPYAQFALYHLKQEGVTPTAIKVLIYCSDFTLTTQVGLPQKKQQARHLYWGSCRQWM